MNVLKSRISYPLRPICREECKVREAKLLKCVICSSGHSSKAFYHPRKGGIKL